MNKLLALAIASTFALGSVSTFATNAKPAQSGSVKHAVMHPSQDAKQGALHQVKHAKKRAAKRHARKAHRKT